MDLFISFIVFGFIIILELPSSIAVYKFINLGSLKFGVSPLMSAQELFSIGYKIVIFPASALRVTMKNTQVLYQEIKKEGAQKSFLHKMQTRQELYELIDYDAYAKLDKKAANYKLKKNESK